MNKRLLAVVICFVVVLFVLYVLRINSPVTAVDINAELPFECSLTDPHQAKTVQVFIQRKTGSDVADSFVVVGRQEVLGQHQTISERFSAKYTHLAIIYDKNGSELSRQAVDLIQPLAFDFYNGTELSGGVAMQDNAPITMRYAIMGNDVQLHLYALPPSKSYNQSRSVYDFDPTQMQASYQLALR